MLGAIIGDVAGSTFENNNCKIYDDIELIAKNSSFTDDTVMTIATADYILHHHIAGKPDTDANTKESKKVVPLSYTDVYQYWGRKFPRAGYGWSFKKWFQANNPKPYNSFGNGSAMRASPIAWVAKDIDWAMEEAGRSAEVTHNHPEGIKGAQAVVAAIFLAKTGKNKDDIREYVQNKFGYDMERTVDQIRPNYKFEVSCQRSVPEAIICFLESKDFEDAIRLAISLGGDSDTIACITGSIAQAYYCSIPLWMIKRCRKVLDPSLLEVLDRFCERVPISSAKVIKADESANSVNDSDMIEE